MNFIPLVVESLGDWDEEAAAIIKVITIGRLLSQRLGTPPTESTAISLSMVGHCPNAGSFDCVLCIAMHVCLLLDTVLFCSPLEG